MNSSGPDHEELKPEGGRFVALLKLALVFAAVWIIATFGAHWLMSVTGLATAPNAGQLLHGPLTGIIPYALGVGIALATVSLVWWLMRSGRESTPPQ